MIFLAIYVVPDIYFNVGFVPEAQKALNVLEERGVMHGREPLLTLIHAYSLRGDVLSARGIFDKILQRENRGSSQSVVLSDPNVYHQMCSAFRRAGQEEELADFMLRHRSVEDAKDDDEPPLTSA